MITENASLKPLNTFGVEARARWLVSLRDCSLLPQILQRAPCHDQPLLVLGEGSNILFTRDFDGVVLHLESRRVTPQARADGSTLVQAEAGHPWHAFVDWTLRQGYAGLENLSLIPGTVGASPIQNIGAYGVEVCSFVECVDAWDRQENRWVRLAREECLFGYRHSVFKQHPDRYIVTSVHFAFHPGQALQLGYPGIREELERGGITQPRARDVSDAICRIRRRKLPDPGVSGNAGSFFKNPIISAVQADALRGNHPHIPVFPAPGGQAKLSAAWLIEQLGFKGQRLGDAGVSDRHALVLINHGQATGKQVLALANRIQEAVASAFQVTLEPEPRII